MGINQINQLEDGLKTLTKEWLLKENACASGMKWFLAQGETNTKKVMLLLIEENRVSDSRWLMRRIPQTKEQSVKIAIFAAELVIGIFEKKYSNDERPRKAINAAKEYLSDPSEENKKAAAAAAADDAWAAAADAADAYAAYAAATYAAATYAADAATYAAYAATTAGDAASHADAACAAAAAAADAHAACAAADDARKQIQKKITEYAIDILGL